MGKRYYDKSRHKWVEVEDGRDRRVVPDGGSVRTPLMLADGSREVRWARPVERPSRGRLSDSAPTAKAAVRASLSDWAAFALNRPGYRVADMPTVTNDTVDARSYRDGARDGWIARARNAWRGRDQQSMQRGYQGTEFMRRGYAPPTGEGTTSGNRGSGGQGPFTTPSPAGGELVDARSEYMQRLTDGWKFNHSPPRPLGDAWQGRRQADAVARHDSLRDEIKRQRPNVSDAEASYAAKSIAMSEAWKRPAEGIYGPVPSGGGQGFISRTEPEIDSWRWRLNRL